jgi:hypothetical protein
LNSFSEELAENNSDSKETYQPSETEINQSLTKAKAIDKTIFKDIHPEEYKQQ